MSEIESMGILDGTGERVLSLEVDFGMQYDNLIEVNNE